MRKLFAFVILLGCLLLAWSVNRSPAATGTSEAPVPSHFDVHPGDEIGLYLNHSTSSSRDSIGGKLIDFDGTTFEVSGEVTAMTAKGTQVGFEHRNVIWMVPRASVCYVEKTLNTQFEPTTRP